jgi:dihydrolipoamide dehydrogenase
VDVVFLGAGGGAYPGAFFLAKAGLSVVMADPIGNLGGDCLAEGCVPSKAVREASLVRATAGKFPFFGLTGTAPSVDWRGVLTYKDGVQQRRYRQHEEEIRGSSLIFHAGRGRIVGDRRVEINDAQGTHHYQFRYLVIATGSCPHSLSVPGAELAITSHDLFRVGADLSFPNHIIVIGGGYIGVEVASMLQNLGAKATVLEFTAQLLTGFDDELAKFVHERLSSRIQIEMKAEVVGIERREGGFGVRYRQGGKDLRIVGDAVLMATGRAAVLPDGIEFLGLSRNAAGHLAVDEQLRTAHPQVYAPGDLNGRSMLFHSAVRQSVVAAHNILAGGQPAERMDFESVPATVFTEPEVASVGLTESQAKDRGMAAAAERYDYAVDSRAQILGEAHGFIKLVFDRFTGRLIGAQIAGVDAAQLIAPLTVAVSQRLSAHALTESVFPHPMLSEGINRAASRFCP